MSGEEPRGTLLGHADTIAASDTPQEPVDASDDEAATSPDLPRYARGRLLGQGGMGEVHAARDQRLGREVAVKVIRPAPGGSFWPGRKRFLREARVQGQLEHPSIVPVYDLELLPHGETRLYMKRVRGLTLESVLASIAAKDPATVGRFSRRRLLTAFVSVCRGLDYAHSRGVVHRDIKPGNIMLGDFGEVHVLDWGIARVASARDPEPRAAGTPETPQPHSPHSQLPLPDQPTLEAPPPGSIDPAPAATAAGTLLGTPGYMAPEQARGEVHRVDARSDVFSLGAVLFEILTREPLLPGAGPIERLRATLEMLSPPLASAAAPDADIPPELDTVCLRSCAPAPEDRFPSAGALAEAIDRYLDGDRDLALRKSMAQDLVQSARAELAQGTGESHASAVRALTRALALDPRHQEASEQLGRLLMETPRELPREAREELEDLRRQTSSAITRIGVVRMVGAAVLVVLGALMGLRRPEIGALAVLGVLVGGSANLLWLRARSERARGLLRTTAVLCVAAGLTAVSHAFGPAIVVPAVSTLSSMMFLAQSDFRKPALVMAASGVPVLWLFALAALGAGPWPYDITPDRILIPANLVSFPPGLTMFVLALTSVMQVLIPLAAMGQLRSRLRSVEERMFLHSWHLRQLARAPG